MHIVVCLLTALVLARCGAARPSPASSADFDHWRRPAGEAGSEERSYAHVATATVPRGGDTARLFGVLFVRSSGSTWLASLLNRQRGVLCHDEHFGRGDNALSESVRAELSAKVARALTASGELPPRVKAAAGSSKHMPSKAYRHELERAELERLASPVLKAKLDETQTALGFKQKALRVHHSMARTLTALWGGKLVVLWRTNRVAHALSLLRKDRLIDTEAKRRTRSRGARPHIANLVGNVAYVEEQYQEERNRSLVVDWELFERSLDYVELGRATLKHYEQQAIRASSPDAVLSITYEDLVHNTGETLRRVVQHINGTADGLRFPLPPSEQSVFRLSSANPLEHVSNRDEFVQRLRATHPELNAELEQFL